jgi:DNA-binding response OmpR family regulator
MGTSDNNNTKPVMEPIKVLIADDDTPTRILLRAAVSQWGYQVIEAGDGEAAWEILQREQPPELLILDWLMPKLDGIDLCKRIQQQVKFKPYIILLTQLSGTTNIVKGLESGADEFLSKPFNMAELQSRLSVGARIIHYKIRLAKKNAELESVLQQANEIAGSVTSVGIKFDELINECISAGVGSEVQARLQKLRQLNADFTQIQRELESLGEHLVSEGDET